MLSCLTFGAGSELGDAAAKIWLLLCERSVTTACLLVGLGAQSNMLSLASSVLNSVDGDERLLDLVTFTLEMFGDSHLQTHA